MIIRDYIYMDTDRVKSIYAQASGGLVESITNAAQTSESMAHREEITESQVKKDILLGSERSETKVLHDYLFTEVEKRLSAFIKDVDAQAIEQLNPGDFIRISGAAEIDEPERMLKLAERYNSFYGGILLAEQANEIDAKRWALEEQLHEIDPNPKEKTSRLKKQNIEKELRALLPEVYLRSMGHGIPRLTVENLKLWLELLYKDILEFRITPPFDGHSTFRAIVQPEHLRESTATLYAKYGSRSQVNLTLMGQITTFYPPDSSDASATMDSASLQVNAEGVSSESNTTSTASVATNLRDAIENLYVSIAEIEKILVISASRRVWVVTPIAIYHETRAQ